MNCKIQKCLQRAVSVAVMLLLAGCGEKTCHFVAPDAGGLEPKAPVEWHNATIGEVKSVQPGDDGVRVDIVFDANHKESVHDGVMAMVQSNPSRWPRPYVELFSGLDEKRPILKSGVRIPMMWSDNVVEEKFIRFDDWLSGKSEQYIAGLVALLGLIKIFGKRIGSFLRKLFWLVFFVCLIYIVFSVRTDWQSYLERFSNLGKKIERGLEENGGALEKVNKSAIILEPLVEDDDD